MGYSTLRLSVVFTAGLCMTCALSAFAQDATGESATTLGRIVLGAGAPKVAIDAAQSITVIDESDIDNVQPGTIGDVLERTPGVSTVGSESRFGESFNIRGIGGGTSADEPRIVTVIDGVKKYYESYRQGSLFTDPDFFKEVEILRGPSSSTLYGSGALAGVISLETKDASDYVEEGERFGAEQEFEYRTNGKGFESSTFLAFRPDERFELLLGYVYDDSDFLEDGAGEDIPGTEITENNVLLKGGLSFGDDSAHRLEAAYIRYNGEANDQVLDIIDSFSDFGTVDREVTDTTAILAYSYEPAGSNLIDLDFQVGFSESKNFVTDFQDPVPGSPFFTPSDVFDSDYEYESKGFKLQNISSWVNDGSENYLTLGFEYYTQDRITLRATPSNATFQPEGTTTTLSAFAQNEFIWNDRFTVLAGLRADFQDTEPGELVPTDDETSDTAMAATLALHYKLTEATAVFGSVSYTERLPVIDELYDSRRTTGGADQVSAGSLDTESSVNFELGASYDAFDVMREGDEFQLKGTVFRHNLKDLIARNNAGGAGEPTFINIDEARFTGFEVEGAYDSETFFGSLALTVIDGENVSDPDAINPNLENRIPSDTLRLTLGTRLPTQDLEFGWTGTYYVDKSRFSTPGGVLTETQTPSNLIHDIYASWTPDEGPLDGAEVRLGISNLLDADYRTHLQNENIRRAGRSINLTLGKTF